MLVLETVAKIRRKHFARGKHVGIKGHDSEHSHGANRVSRFSDTAVRGGLFNPVASPGVFPETWRAAPRIRRRARTPPMVPSLGLSAPS